MTIARTKTWAFGEKLTSDQINAVDTSATYALDKRSGQTDTLASAVTVTGATVFSGTTAINGAMTVTAPIVTSNTITTTSGIVFNAGNTVTGNMHLAGTQTVDTGGLITVASGGAFTLQAGSTNTLTGATITGGTFASTTLSSPTLSGTMTGGTLASTTLSSPTLSGTMTGGTVSSALTPTSFAIAAGNTFTRAGAGILSLVNVYSARLAIHSIITATSMTAISLTATTGNYVTFSAVAGDILIVDAGYQSVNSGGNTFIQVVVSDGGVGAGAPQDVAGAREIVTNDSGFVSIHFAYTVVGTGTIQIYGKAQVSAGSANIQGTDSGSGDATLRVLQYRP